MVLSCSAHSYINLLILGSSIMSNKTPLNVFTVALLALLLGGCVGTAIETATDAAIAVAKVPFKVVGAAADVISGDDDDDD